MKKNNQHSRPKGNPSGAKKEAVIVTGGAGFIGSHLVRALCDEGYEVHVIDNLSLGKKEKIDKRAVFHLADITKPKDLEKVFSSVGQIACVFHLAALPRVQFSIDYPRETNEANITGTLNVLIAAKDHKAKRVVYSGSSSAYGDQPKMPFTEDMPANPKSPYGLQKYVGELYMKMFSLVYGLPTVSFRYFNIYAHDQDPHGAYALVIGKFVDQVKHGKPMTITGDGEQTRDFTHISDAVRANILAMKSKKVGKGEVLNIGAGNNVSVNHIAKLIGGKTTHIPPRLEPKHTKADNSLAKKLLGWTPKVSIEEGIAEIKKIHRI